MHVEGAYTSPLKEVGEPAESTSHSTSTSTRTSTSTSTSTSTR